MIPPHPTGGVRGGEGGGGGGRGGRAQTQNEYKVEFVGHRKKSGHELGIESGKKCAFVAWAGDVCSLCS